MQTLGVVSDRTLVNDLLLKDKRELRSLAVCALYFQMASHHVEQTVDDRHAEARSFDVAVALLLDTLK